QRDGDDREATQMPVSTSHRMQGRRPPPVSSSGAARVHERSTPTREARAAASMVRFPRPWGSEGALQAEIVIVALFSVATAVALVARRLKLPYTVALVLAGLGL